MRLDLLIRTALLLNHGFHGILGLQRLLCDQSLYFTVIQIGIARFQLVLIPCDNPLESLVKARFQSRHIEFAFLCDGSRRDQHIVEVFGFGAIVHPVHRKKFKSDVQKHHRNGDCRSTIEFHSTQIHLNDERPLPQYSGMKAARQPAEQSRQVKSVRFARVIVLPCPIGSTSG